MSTRHLPLLLLALPLLLLGPADVLAAEAGVTLESAQSELRILKTGLRSPRSTNADLQAALCAVEHAYLNVQAPADPDVPLPDAKLARDHERALRSFEKDAAELRRDAEKLFLKALKLTRLVGKPKENIRVPVNEEAARILGGIHRPALTKSVIAAVEASILHARYDVPASLVETAFAALGRMGDPDALAWLVKDFTHTKNSPPREVDQLVAAHRAMALFPLSDVPSVLRFRLVDRMVTMYAGVESTARQSSSTATVRSARELWDRIRADVIRAVQVYAGEPRNDAGEVLATMAEFQAWLRDHENPRQAPWTN